MPTCAPCTPTCRAPFGRRISTTSTSTLSRLIPDTTYYYGVGHHGFDPASAGNLATLGEFTTAPRRRQAQPAGAYTFTAFGDQGVSYDALANDSVLLGQNPRFHLHAGDIAYADSSGQGKPVSSTGANGTDIYDPRIWDQFLAQTELVAKQVPWMVATGNHDMEALYSPDGYGGQQARWAFPGNGPASCPSVYSFIYGNVAYNQPRRQRRLERDHGQPGLQRRRADHLAAQTAGLPTSAA